MLSMVALDDQPKDRQTTGLIRKSSNLIGFSAEFSKQALQMIGGTNMTL
jgi:hypothetical protein